jgi:hypothetical protein
MASIINASTTSTSGLVQTADSSGILQLQSNGTTGLTVEANASVTINTTLQTPYGRVEPFVIGTAQTTTSGTSIDVTGIPNWAKRITLMLNGVSISGTSGIIVQLIVNGTPVNTGYIGASDLLVSGVAPVAHTTGFALSDIPTVATYTANGCLTFIKFSDTVWNGSFVGSSSVTAAIIVGAGYVPVSGTVTGVRITTPGGANTFDAGSVNIMYE